MDGGDGLFFVFVLGGGKEGFEDVLFLKPGGGKDGGGGDPFLVFFFKPGGPSKDRLFCLA
tara:strand:+ start:711 stop:890 length:180 start_codon:yes stop_codon:yes gene_type:complete